MKHINLTQMLQGCSKRNGMTVSASNPDGEPTVNRQSRLMSLSGKKAEKEQLSPSCLLSASFPLSFRSRYLRYAAMIFCVLAMNVANIGMAWGDTKVKIAFNSSIASDSTATHVSTSGDDVSGVTVLWLTSGTGSVSISEQYNRSSSTKENVLWIANDASENYNQYYLDFSSSSSISKIDLLAIVGGSTSNSKAVVVGWSGTVGTTITEYHEITTYGRGNKTLSTITFTASNIKHVRVYRKIKLDSSTKKIFQASSATAIPSSASSFGISLANVYLSASGGGSTTYSVTYDGNGKTSGSVPTDANSPYANGATVTVLGNTGSLAKTGYTFTGWNTAADGSGTDYAAGETFSMGTANVTLYAQWELNLSTHEPGKYETAAGSGGYGKTLKTVDGRDFEVYMFNSTTLRAGSATTISDGLSMLTASNGNDVIDGKEGWICVKSTGDAAGSGATQKAEFSVTSGTSNDQKTHYIPISNAGYIKLKVSGYDQFSMVGRDGSTTAGSGKFVVKIDGASQSLTSTTTDHSVYRFSMTTGTHTIEVTSDGSTACRFRGFSLRLPATCTAPNHVDVTGRWDRFAGETISLTATAYSSTGTGSPIAAGNITGYQWQKLVGSTWTDVSNGTESGAVTTGATTANLQIMNCIASNSGKYRCVVSTGATCSTASATATDGSQGLGVKVYTLECYTGGTTVYNFNRTGDTQAGTLQLNLAAGNHTFKFHADNIYYGNNGTINEDVSNWVCSTTQGNLTIAAGLGGTFTINMEYSTGGSSSVEGEPEISVTYPRKTIYLTPGVWKTPSDGEKFAYRYFRDGGSGGWTDFLTSDDCGMYADIPQWNGVKIIPCRLKNTTVSPGSWDDRWNQTNDITVSSYNSVVITGWNAADYTYNSNFSTPTYTISYNAGTGGSGTKADESKTCGVDFTLPNSAVFTRTGYTQTGWATTDGGAQEYALGGTYTTNEDKTFYPVWTANNYDLTWNLGGGTTTSTGTGIASGVSSNTTTSQAFGTALSAPTVTKTGYNFSAWSPAVASTMPAENTTYTATWTAQTYTISYMDQGNVTYSGSNLASLPTSHTYGVATALLVGVKTGYTFVGWFTDAECTVSAGMSIGTTAITANTTLYAKWTIKQTTITIDANTAIHGSTAPSPITATYGSALPSFTAAAGESGWNLTGYFTEATSGTKVINANGTLVAGTDYADGSGNWKYETATLTLYAQYEEAEAGCVDANSTNFGEGNSSGDASKTLDDGTVVSMYKCTNSASSVSIGGNILFTAPTGKAFETFSFVATCGSDSKTNYYKINGGSQQNLESSTTTSKRYTITVPVSPNTTTIQIIKNGTTPAVTEFCYTYKDVCTTPATAFANGAYTVGGSALDLSTLISGKEGTGAITYTVKNANGTGAAIDGSNFTATVAGTATVTATQAADATYCEKEMDATITVSACGGYPAGYIYITDVKATPETGASGVTATGGSYDNSLDGSFSHDGYTKWFQTSGASGYYQLNFSPALDVSSYTDLKVDLWWGVNTGSNRGTTVYVNGTSVGTRQVDSKTRYQLLELSDLAVTATSISSIKIEGGGGGANSVFFRVGVKGTPATPCTVAPTVSATTKGATTSTTQVVNCSGISSLGTGTCTITSYGFVYGTSANPTLLNSHVDVGTSYTVTGTAFAETTLTGLTQSTTYYVRAYATNGAGTGYGDAVSFTTSAAPAGAPVITVQPTLSEVALGETASFSLTATGATSYKWYSCDSEGENRVEASGTSATTDNYSYTTTATGTTYYICKVSNASGDTWSDVVGSIVTPVSFTIHYEAGSTDKTSYTTETFTQNKVVNAEVADYIGSLTKFAFNGVEISDKGKKGTMSMQISMPTSEDAGKYVSFTFTVAPNYYLSVDNINIKCQPVGNDNHNYKVVLTDALGTTITGTSSTNTKGELNSINFPAAQLSGKRLVGLVTVKIFGWYSSSDTYRLAKDTYITGTVSSLPAPTASWTARPASATVGDGGKTYTLTTDETNTVAWSITDQSGATGAVLSSADGMTTTLGSYTTAGSLYVQASVTGDGIHYLSTPATLLRQRVVISGDCSETTLISATLSSGSGTGAVTGTPGGTSAVSFTSVKEVDGGYKMGGDGSYVYLTLSGDENFAANDEVKITITKASDQGDGALHIYKYASETWTELGSVTAAGAGTYSYTLTETNVSTAFNTIGLYRTGKNQNPYVKALSVVRNSCSASKPSSVTVTASAGGPYDIDDALTLTVEATNADTYQWYSNTNNTASDGFLLVGETATTYSPSTAIAGTTYYYCVATNTSGSTVSNIITVTVNSAKTAPTVSWTDTYETPNYGGGGYAVKATVSDASWDGTLTTDMLTASDGVTLSGVSVAGKVITATYGVTETARSPLSFSLTLPETTNYTALAANKEISFTRCGEGAVIETTETKLAVKSSYTTASNPTYRWETDGVGWLTLVTGSSTLSSTSDSYSGFSYRSSSGKSSITFYSELDAVSAVRIYIKGGGSTTLSKVQKGTTLGKYTQLAPSTDYDYSYSNGSSSIESREQAYIEITFKTSLAANTFVEITLSRNTEYYGVGLITGNSEVGNITTALSWATNPGATVNKTTTDANFRYEAEKASDAASQATLGTISYKSSVPAVATVSATGVVDILSAGSTTITATLASSGCYKKATLSYNLAVAEATCTDEAGTITASGTDITIDGNTVTKADACAAVTLTVSGHTGEDAGATYQWYQDGVSMGESYRSKSISVTANGDYTVEVTNAGGEHCPMPATNTITITGNAISITKIVDEWYVKNGRRTPDIALATIEGTTDWSVKEGETDITSTGLGGCMFYMQDGVVYLKGQQENGDEPSGLTAGNATLTINAVNTCGDDPTATITIHKQVETAKPSIAFVVDGTSGDPVNSVATTKTSSRPIWIYLSESFDLTGCNAYWTNNEKLIRQYYSQFDAIVITDDPSTDAKPKSGLKYVNALGTMVDVRPILTMEAYVGKYGASSNWHIGGTPSSPNPRQYEMKLQCKDHDIFFDLTPSANFRSEEIGGETYYYVTMVDNSVTPYAGLADDAETETYPALQGFSAASIKGTGMLGIGTISDGTLQGGVERQDEQTARMMILGIQHQAMAALTSEGKQVIKNAINYLLKTNMEEVDDCSNYFIGTDDSEWSKASNWSSGKVPDASTKARILVPVTISTKVHVAQVDIAVDGRSKHYDSGNTDCSGSVTIASTGALIVDGQVRRTTNGRLYTEEELQPTQIEDLTIGSDESNGNGTLIFDNSEGESQAIVQYYSKANTNENDEWNWQYMAVPFNDNSSAYRNFYDSYLYRWAENCSGWEVVPNQGAVYPWVGYTITQVGKKMYYMDGTLVETGEQTFTVPAGKNLVLGNSWTAPIQVKQFEDADFAGMSKNVYLFNTGYDYDKTGTFDKADGRYEGGTYVTIPIHSSPYTGDSLISSLQAFIVYAKTGEGGGTFTLDYDRHVRPARSTDKVNAGQMHAPKRGGVINDKPAVLKVWASGSRYDDRLIVLEREDFSTGLDEGWDGNKRVAGNSSPLIFAVTDNGREAVSAIPTMEGTLIGFWAGEDNEYTLHFEYNEEDELYLLDLDNNTYTPVNSNSTYVFTVPDKKAHNRFILTRNAPDPVATGVEETQANEKPEAKAIKFLKDEKVFIFVNGKLYDATGKVVK